MAMFQDNIGPCKLVYGGADLGETHGDVMLKFSQATAKGTAASTGETARQKVVTGEECTVEADLTEVAAATLVEIVAGAEQRGSSVKTTAFQTAVGKDLVKTAKTLILKPISEGQVSADNKEWIYIPKASVNPDFNVAFSASNQKVYRVVFEAHPVLAADIATGGFLASASPAYEARDLIRFGGTQS